MREHKYRAWLSTREEWHYFTIGTIQYGIADCPSPWIWWCEYTGLKDKNGAEIYENNKVVWDGGEYEIKWSGEFGWILKDDRDDWECPNLYSISSPKQSRIEIIGKTKCT